MIVGNKAYHEKKIAYQVHSLFGFPLVIFLNDLIVIFYNNFECELWGTIITKALIKTTSMKWHDATYNPTNFIAEGYIYARTHCSVVVGLARTFFSSQVDSLINILWLVVLNSYTLQ